MQYEFQKTFDGGFEPVFTPSVRDLFARVPKSEEETSSDRVRKAILLDPRTESLLRHGIPRAIDYDMAKECFVEWLYAIPAFESLARGERACRDEFGHDDTGVPEWYMLYLGTEHWTRVKTHCRNINFSCVLCGAVQGELHTHHRSYLTLGRESERDVTLLCDRCHQHIHRFVHVPFPSACPTAVRSILLRELNYVWGEAI